MLATLMLIHTYFHITIIALYPPPAPILSLVEETEAKQICYVELNSLVLEYRHTAHNIAYHAEVIAVKLRQGPVLK